MGLLDTILGRTKPVPANLDALFAIPSASISLQSSSGLVCSGHAGVCFKAPSGQGIQEMQAQIEQLLSMDAGSTITRSDDRFGYTWLTVADPDIEALVTQVHLINSSLADAGWGPQLLWSVFGLAAVSAAAESSLVTTDDLTAPGPGQLLTSSAYLVYLFKRGTFYPFVPATGGKRDMQEELRLKALLVDDLTVEADLSRWSPIDGLPVA